MKKVVLFIIMFFCFISVDALSYKDISITNYVNDKAGVLSTEVVDYINTKSKTLENADGTQIVVVTIDTLAGNDLEDFANDLFNYNGLGNKDKDNGLLILLVVKDRLLRVEVGDGLEGILNDGKVGRYEDKYMIPYLKKDDWDNAIKNGFDAFYSEIAIQNKLDLDTNPPVDGRSDDIISERGIVIGFVIAWISMAIGVLLHDKPFSMADVMVTLFNFTPFGYAYLRKLPDLSVYFVIGVIALLLYICGRISDDTVHGGGSSSWSSSSGGHSSGGGGFSGGGGHSSGGGASRHF